MTVAPLLFLAFFSAASPAGSTDPRVRLVELQVARDPAAALAHAEAIEAVDARRADDLGIDYVRGRLLDVLDQGDAARNAFAETLTTSPELAPWARMQLAREQDALGHPEVAAGLVAGLIGGRPPKVLLEPSVRLLERTIRAGGDCRLLGALRRVPFERDEARRFALAEAECAARGGDGASRRRALLGLLREDTEDDVALDAALRLAPEIPPGAAGTPAESQLLLGYAFFHHREFDRALRYLSSALASTRSPGGVSLSARELYELRYALARSLFWLERFEPAAEAFAAIARSTSDVGRKSRALYQRARSLELLGPDRWDDAIRAFDETYATQTDGRWSSAAILSALRLLWRTGREEEALRLLERLRERRRASETARSLLFIASSDLAQGRADRAGAWLDQAARLGRLPEIEITYWRARSAEASGRLETALGRYVDVLRIDPYHPYGTDAATRLRAPGALGDLARRSARAWVSSDRYDRVEGAWLVLGADDRLGRRALERLRVTLQNDPRARTFLELEPVPPAEWPLWDGRLERPQEKLLALGLFEEGGSQVLRHFPIAKPRLAFTGSRLLARSGATKRSLYIAEILAQRVPSRMPHELLPVEYRRLLYPFRYSYLVLRESARRDIDPSLLAGLIREESRYDPEAFSGASARGLAQFILPTARRIAELIELGPIEPRDLHDPEIAVALGAAYLGELSKEFDGRVEQMAAGYNAGEPQSALWRQYCFTNEMPEFVAKVVFKETRGYVAKVLTSRAHYAALYGSSGGASESATDDASETETMDVLIDEGGD